jgi:hypothetical protein
MYRLSGISGFLPGPRRGFAYSLMTGNHPAAQGGLKEMGRSVCVGKNCHKRFNDINLSVPIRKYISL